MHRVILCRTMRFQMNANLEPRAAPSTDLMAAVLEAKAEMAKSQERRVIAIVALVLVFIFVLLF